jgi:hypothetical protein
MRRADCTQSNYRSGRKGVERSHGAPSSIKHPRHLRGLERLQLFANAAVAASRVAA